MKLLWMVAALSLVACKKSEPSDKAGKAAPAAGKDAAKPAPTPAPDAAPVAAAPPDAAPPPKFPPLGAPPAGLDPQLATACDAGDGKACLAAAKAFEPRGAYRVDMTKEEGDLHLQWTQRYGERACQYDLGEGCALAARFAPFDQQSALTQRGCDLGFLYSCGVLGSDQIMDKKTQAKGLALMEQACRADAVAHADDKEEHGKLCAELADHYSGKGYAEVPADAAKAKELHELACQQGHKLGCPCTEATVEKDCGVPDEFDRWYCSDEGLCDLEAPG